ncbi:hypothetical protein DT073_13355 [Microbacterium sp. ABRD28]|nr:hypothetical protein DT073_13355 [Microbacterium sp. ABRD28]
MKLHPERPRRVDYRSDPDFLVACLVWLDHTFPKRRKRIAEWQRLERESDVDYVRERLRELLALDESTEEEDAEFARLAAVWKTNHHRQEIRP